MKRALTKQGLSFELETRVMERVEAGKKVKLSAVDGAGKEKELSADRVLVAVGRKPFTDGLGLEELGIERQNGRIRIDGSFQTNVPGIYAIGDLVPGPMLAHKAEEEGIAVAENLAGFSGHVSYGTIPNVVYTWPEAASVGPSEQDLKARNIPYKKGVFSFGANGRSLAMGEREGFAKILAGEKTDEILGAHIVGPWASDLIMEAVTTMEYGGSAEDMARTSHPHPTLSEVMREASLAVDGRAIHRI
jgi:dihydrolipoamide dehydrogenase